MMLRVKFSKSEGTFPPPTRRASKSFDTGNKNVNYSVISISTNGENIFIIIYFFFNYLLDEKPECKDPQRELS